MIIIKIQFSESEIRRLAVETLMSFAALRALITNMFASSLKGKEYQIKYTDTDGEEITVDSDLELQEALRQSSVASAAEPQLLRLFVREVGIQRTVDTPATPNTKPVEQSNPLLTSSAFHDLGISQVPPQLVAKPEEPVTVAAPVVVVEEVRPQEEIKPKETAVPSPQVASASSSAPASPPAVAASATSRLPPSDVKDLTISAIESELKKVFATITDFLDSLNIDRKFLTVMDACHTQLKAAAATAHDLFAKAKSVDAHAELDKLKNEINTIKLKINKALDEFATFVGEAATVVKSDISAAAENINAAFHPNADPAHAASKPAPVPGQEQPTKPALAAAQASPAPAPAAVPATAAAVPLPSNMASEDLQRLADMGFTDVERNLQLLTRYNGDLVAVVNTLLA